MPSILCNAPQGETYQTAAPITFDFTIEPPVVLPTSYWTRSCAANDPNGMPEYATAVVIPSGLTVGDVNSFTQFESAYADLSIDVINIVGNAFSTTQRGIINATHNTAGNTRYITGTGTPPAILFIDATGWTITDMDYSGQQAPSFGGSNATPEMSNMLYFHNCADIMVDNLRRSWSSGSQTFCNVSNGYYGRTDNFTMQLCELEYTTENPAEFMGIIYGGWLPNVEPANFTQFGHWPARAENFIIQDNKMIGMGDAVQFLADLYSSPASYARYSEGEMYEVHIRGNYFDAGPTKQAENAIDLKLSSNDPARPCLIYDNYMTGYLPVTGNGTTAQGEVIVIHMREQYVNIYRNIMTDASIGVSFKAKNGVCNIEDNVFMDIGTLVDVQVHDYGVYLEEQYHDRLIEINFNRNIGLNANRVAELGSGTTIQGQIDLNCNFFDGLNHGTVGSPITGPAMNTGVTVSGFSGSNNYFDSASPANVPGGTQLSWLGTATNLTVLQGFCGQSTGSDQITIPSAAVIPASCSTDFVFAV